MEHWEYQVIHLNVEAPAQESPAPPAAPPAPMSSQPSAPAPQPATLPPQAVFSRDYLEKEFPGFYAAPHDSGAPRNEHPAHQLRGFLNGQGREGWLLVGFFPVGQLTMMVFRRPLPPVNADGVSSAVPEAVPQPTASAGPVPDLTALLARLEALEARLGALPAPTAAPLVSSPAGPETSADPQRSSRAGPPDPALEARTPREFAALEDGDLVSEECLSELALPRCATSEAAHSLGFRSAASLLNVAARSGYRSGLVKRGINGRIAIYVGSGRNERGGRDRRWWVVLPAAD